MKWVKRAVGLLAAVIGFLVFVSIQNHFELKRGEETLGKFHHILHNEFRHVFAQITEACRETKYEGPLTTTPIPPEDLEKFLAAIPEVYSATWSLNGHHGVDSLKRGGDGLSHFLEPVFEASGGKVFVYFGETNDGDSVIYEAWLDDCLMRCFRVTFLQRDIAELDLNSTPAPNKSASSSPNPQRGD